MATLKPRNKRKLAALNKENCQEHPRSNLEQNSNVPRSLEDYIAQISEENEGRVTNQLSQEFSTTESCILGVLSRFHEFLHNPLKQAHYEPHQIQAELCLAQTRERKKTTSSAIIILTRTPLRVRNTNFKPK